MTSTRKLLIAVLLVAGGYAVALVVGRGGELLLSSASAPPGNRPEGGWFAGLKSVVSGNDDSASIGQLVPVISGEARPIPGALVATPRESDAPIWLKATTEQNAVVAVATQPQYAEAPEVGFAEPPPAIPALPTQRIVDESPTTPKVRITNVVAAGSKSSQREASQWDRWPRWDSSDATSAQGSVAATFQESTTATAGMVPVTYSSAVIARNTPARDVGPETAAIDRTHVVVDGDSLQRLAERYLDDPTLGDEIYRLNRDVLTSPDLLPIGVELRIPDDRMADSGVSRAASNMVPVEWTPRPFEGPPRAELLAPVSAGRRD